jgi:hypothetical protein
VAVAAALACGVAVLSGCGASARDRAEADLQDRLDGVHGGFLERRALDPTSTGAAAADSLDHWGYSLQTTYAEDSVTFLRTIDARVETGGGLWYEQVSLGACVEVVVGYGAGGDDRGTVRTEPVACPAGTELPGTRGPAGTVPDLDGRSDDVGLPPYVPPVCHSGGDCSRGGG